MLNKILKEELQNDFEDRDYYTTVKNNDKIVPDKRLTFSEKIKIALNPFKNPYSPFLYPLRKKINYYYNHRVLNDINLAKGFEEFYLSKIELESKDINVLDFGCGQGRTIALLNQLGYKNIIGQDILHFDYWKKLKSTFLKIPIGYKDFYPYKDESFEVIFSFQVHMYLNDQLLENHINNISRILKQGGYFIFEDRNENMLNPSYYTNNISCPYIHKREKIISLLKENNFEIIEEKTYGISTKFMTYYIGIIQNLIVSKEKFDIFSYKNKSWFDKYLSKKIPKGKEPLHLLVCRKIK